MEKIPIIALGELDDSWRLSTGLIHVVPGWNGSPAYLNIDEAVKEFWSDRKHYLRMKQMFRMGHRTDLPTPTVIELHLRKSGSLKTWGTRISVDDEFVLECPRCGFPKLPERKCLACGTNEDELPIESRRRLKRHATR